MSARWGVRLFALLLIAGYLVLPDFHVSLASNIGLYAIVALGLVMMTGVAGMTSFGQAAFVGLGAYATAWLGTAGAQMLGFTALHPALPWLGLLLGCLITAAVAGVLGAVTLRLSGHFLPLGTIAWGLSLYFLFGNLEMLGGHTGMSGVPALRIGPWAIESPRAMGGLIWLLVMAMIWALTNLLDSRPGRAIRALKSGRIMAESMGVDTTHARLKVFVLAALLAALSGWLYAHLQRFINPTPFSLTIGIEYLFMAVVGGAGHLWGAVLGAALITVMKQQLQDVLPQLLGFSGSFEGVVFGLLMLLVLQRYADGVWPTIQRLTARARPATQHLALQSVQENPEEKTQATTQVNTRDHVSPVIIKKILTARTLAAPGTIVLEAQGITKRFGGLVANQDIHLAVRAGEIHALIGPNGAGKSTFFNLVSGVDEPSAGTVRLAEQAMHQQPARAFAALGLCRTFQHVRLLRERSVLENVALGAHLRGEAGWLRAMLRLDRNEEAAIMAEAQLQIHRCGLTAWTHTDAGALPLGAQRIVEIARALAAAPSVLLLDEPAAGLRHQEKRQLADLLKQLRAEGLAILVVEHDMEFVMNLADRVSVLDFGQMIAQGTPKEIQQHPAVLQAYLGGVA